MGQKLRSRPRLLIVAAAVVVLALAVAIVSSSGRGESAIASTPASRGGGSTQSDETSPAGPPNVGTLVTRGSAAPIAYGSRGERRLPRGSLRLKVVDSESGAPIPDHPYVLFSERPRDHPIVLGTTDDQGRALFSHLPEDVYLIGTLRRPPFAEAVGGAWLGEGEHVEVNVVVGRGGAIEGRVVDDLGRPISGVEVSARATSRAADFWNEKHGDDESVDTVTDDEGRYRIEALLSEPRGVWIVEGELRPERWEPAGVSATFGIVNRDASAQVEEGETVQVPDLVFGRPHVFAGVVVTESGDPVEGALVSARWERPGTIRWAYEQHEGRRAFMTGPGSEGFELFEGECLTDGSGRFELERRDAGVLRAWTKAGQIAELRLSGSAPGERTDDLEIVVPDQAIFPIEVVDGRGERVTGRLPLVWQQSLYVGNGREVMTGRTAVELGLDPRSIETFSADFDLDPAMVEVLGQAIGSDGLYWLTEAVAHDGDGLLRPSLPPGVAVAAVRVTVPGYSTGSARSPGAVEGIPARVQVEELSTIRFQLSAPPG